jgi:hypothetical protein
MPTIRPSFVRSLVTVWGTTRPAAHSGVPKHACAASASGHTPKCLLPGMFPLE